VVALVDDMPCALAVALISGTGLALVPLPSPMGALVGDAPVGDVPGHPWRSRRARRRCGAVAGVPGALAFALVGDVQSPTCWCPRRRCGARRRRARRPPCGGRADGALLADDVPGALAAGVALVGDARSTACLALSPQAMSATRLVPCRRSRPLFPSVGGCARRSASLRRVHRRHPGPSRRSTLFLQAERARAANDGLVGARPISA
jgi:hypothetical protein